MFEATHSKTGQKVAIKKMEINNENVKLLATEISIMKTSKHPNIVEYLLAFFIFYNLSLYILDWRRYMESYIVDEKMVCFYLLLFLLCCYVFLFLLVGDDGIHGRRLFN